MHRGIAEQALPLIKRRLDEKQVVLRGDKAACAILPGIEAAQEADWSTEYLDYILSVKVVGSIEEAIAHIGRYGTGHSECIDNANYSAAEQFLNEVDAAAVYVNASTGIRMAENLVLARKSASLPKSCMRVVRLGSAS